MREKYDRDEPVIETWQQVWRDGIAPSLSTAELEILRAGLEQNDGRLVQGAVTFPPPLEVLADHAVERACALGYCGWQADGLITVALVDEFFNRICQEAGSRLGDPAACRWFLNWFDEAPRSGMRRKLLAEVCRTLSQRTDSQSPSAA
jgi:hypothetical protein